MKTKTILPVIFLLLPLIGNAQIQPFIWDTLFGGTRADCLYSIEQNQNDGSIVSFGYTRSPSIDGYHVNNINVDGWIIKTNSTGQILWSKAYGTKNDEILSRGKILPNGDLIAVGTIQPAFPVAPMPFDYHGGSDIYVVKTNSNGDTLWQKCYGGSSGDVVNDVVIPPDGSILIVGGSNSTDGDMSNVTHYGNNDGFVMKIDAVTGVVINVKNFGGTFSDIFRSISICSTGGFILAGSTFSNDGIIAGQNHSLNPNATTDMWVMYVDDSLNQDWTKCIGSTGHEAAYSVVDVGSGFLVSGSAIPIVTTPDGDVLEWKGNNDGFIVKLNYSGSILWSKTYGGTLNDFELSLKVNSSNGSVYAFGVTISSDIDIPSNMGNSDCYFLFFDINNGDLQDVGMLGTQYNETVYDIIFLGLDFIAVGQRLPVLGPNWDALIASTSYDFKLTTDTPLVTNIQDVFNKTQSIYPNPTSDKIRITLPPEATTNTVTIFNLSGQILFSEQTSEVVYITDLTQFAQGTYVVEVKNSTGVFRDRVQKL